MGVGRDYVSFSRKVIQPYTLPTPPVYIEYLRQSTFIFMLDKKKSGRGMIPLPLRVYRFTDYSS
jgi:hypothetical protein